MPKGTLSTLPVPHWEKAPPRSTPLPVTNAPSAAQALLLLLGREPDSLASWARAREHFTPAMFDDAVAYDAQQVGVQVWKAWTWCQKSAKLCKILLCPLASPFLPSSFMALILPERYPARERLYTTALSPALYTTAP